jgi:5'-nucleotidase
MIPMPKILVTNDDGVHAEGIRALAAVLAPLGDVTVVAPIQEASAIGHALTLRRPLRIETVAPDVFAIDGTPTDCVNIAITHILKDKPDLIVSGINKGWNLGDDVTYSGTVSGALEGALLGIPSIAVSSERVKDDAEFGPAAEAARIVADAVLERGMPKFTLLNINVPSGQNKGFRVTVQAKRNHVTVVSERTDPRHRAYYWIEEGLNQWEPHDRSDYQAVRDGYISITPLQPDMTAHDALRYVEELPLATAPAVSKFKLRSAK